MHKHTRLGQIILALTLVGVMAGQAMAKAVEIRPTKTKEPPITRQAVKDLLAKRRAIQIARLSAYAARGVFPRNTYAPKVLRVLVDQNGRLCAVANLIALDGHRKLVMETAKTNRFVVFSDLKKGALYDWIFTSGLTQEEIAAIQLPDRRVQIVPDWERAERERLLAHLARVSMILLKNNKASLDLMADRLMKRPELIETLIAQVKTSKKIAPEAAVAAVR